MFLYEIAIIRIIKPQINLPKFKQLLQQIGKNYKLARRRVRLTDLQVFERTDIGYSMFQW